ncbi:MAG TPA: cytochrome P450 [Sandaracinaceae bacterium LLY-WYZ-13_1]|nr:cytochrome P450 [Sandaracinaceae bacterium LLY-WYZ-13_1]
MTAAPSVTSQAPSRPAKARHPVGRPPVLPLLGALVDLRRDTLGTLARNAREHGDLVRFHVLGRGIWQLNHPELVHDAVFRQGKHLDKGYGYRVLRGLMGEGLITASHPVNRRQRPLVAPALTRKVVPRWTAQIRSFVDAWIDGALGRTLDVQASMLDLARSITVGVVLGSESERHVAAARAVELIVTHAIPEIWGLGRFLPDAVPTPSRRALARALADFDRAVADTLAERRARPPRDADVLDAMLAARDADGRPMDDRALRDEIATLFLAGHETTSRTLTQALVLGRTHPESWRALVEEVDRVLGGRDPTWPDLRKLERVRAHALETMRLRPPVWMVTRSATAPMQVGGHPVQPGEELFVPIYLIHHDPRWFDAPDAFRPARWLDGLEARLPRHAFMPFGPPPRRCIGDQLGMMVLQITLARIAQRCRLALKAPEPPLDPGLVLRFAGPARLAFAPRSAAA